MKARTVWSRWSGVALLIGLLALLPTVAVQAEAAGAAYSLAPLAIHCEVEFALEGGDPFMSIDDMDPSCADMLNSEVRNVEFAGNTAWVTAVVDGETEVSVYVKRDGVWERFPYSSAPDAAYLYMLGQENAAQEQANPAPPVAVPSLSTSVDVVSGPEASSADAVYEYLLELENAYIEQHNPGPTATFASPSGSVDVASGPEASSADAIYEYMLELENAYEEQLNPGPTAELESPNVSIDPRGQNYWDEWFARQEGSSLVAPSRASVIPDNEVDLIAMAERELALSGGSKLNTLADLLAELYGSALPGQLAGSEDLTRELE